MSENSSQIGAFPMGAGILFIGDSLSSLENTQPFHSFSLKDYIEWRDRRADDPRPLEPYEPVGYFDMGSTVKVVDKISSKRPCKYVKLVPTAFKKTPNNSFPQERFSTYPVEFKFFGVIGEELDSKLDNEENSEHFIGNSTVHSMCNTKTSYKIQMYNKAVDDWETIHEEDSNVLIHEVQTLGLNFNISSLNLDKIVTWLSGNKLTGICRSSITNSKIQINMIEKLRVIVESPDQQEGLWRLCGFKLSPKALLNIERNHKGIFSGVPVKRLRS